jgi:hypothetical protein
MVTSGHLCRWAKEVEIAMVVEQEKYQSAGEKLTLSVCA